MKKTRQKRASVPAVHRELYRHPHYFMVLFSFVFLGAMAAFLLVLSNVTMKQSQDLRQKAAVPELPDLVISELYADTAMWNQPATIHITVKNRETALAAVTQPFNVGIAFGGSVPNDYNYFRNLANPILIPISPPLAPGETRSLTHIIPANTLSPGYYSLLVVPDPPPGNTVTESYEQDVGYRQGGLYITSTQSQTNTEPPQCGTPSIPPVNGPAPLTVFLHGAGSNVAGYRWDYDGNGTWDSDFFMEAGTTTFNTVGTYRPKFQIRNSSGIYSAVCEYPYTITVGQPGSNETPDGSTTAPVTPTTPAADNLVLSEPHALAFSKASTNESIDIREIMSGENYKVRHTVRIQNGVKNAGSTDARSVTVQFRANDSASSSKNFAMSQLHKANDGIDLVFETTFTGKTSNEFKTTLDTANTVAETKEDDNTLITTYSYQTTTTTVSQSTIAAVCNKYCANDGECSYGLKCSWNKCRHPDNLNNERCAPAASVVAGCNISCSSNRDCAAGLACSSGKCRNPRATTSDTCQASTATTVIATKTSEKTSTTGQKAKTTSLATPTPTPKPSTAAASLETPTPTIDTSTPPPTPSAVEEMAATEPAEPTVATDVLNWLKQLPTIIMEQSNEVPKVVLGWFGIQEVDDSTNLWFWLIGGGLLLIFIILFFSFLGSRREPSLSTMKPPKTTTPAAPAQSPQKSYHAVATGAVVATATTAEPNKASPSMMTAPRPLPPAAVAVKTTTPAANPTANQTVNPTAGSTMVTKLQDRGVIKPSASTPPHTPS